MTALPDPPPGLPSPAELKLLEPLRDKVPPEVFTKAYEPPKTDGSGTHKQLGRVKARHRVFPGWRQNDVQVTEYST